MRSKLFFAALSILLLCPLTWAVDNGNFTLNSAYSAIQQPIQNVQQTARHTGTYFILQVNGRNMAVADINKDGLNDIIYAPSFFDVLPQLPIQIWVNKGGGRFEDQTTNFFDGQVTTVGSPNNVFSADFNGDGIPDVFIVDQGLELVNCSQPPYCTGGVNHLLLSQPNGKLKDVSSTLPDNSLQFNHVSAMADVNNDGHMDIVLVRLGGGNTQAGVEILLNDGHGNFTVGNQLLPSTVSFPIAYSSDYMVAGAVGLADLDGDGLPDLILGTYGKDSSGQSGLRVYRQQRDGKFVEAARIPLAVTDVVNGIAGGGASSIVSADITGDGKPEIVVNWENNGGGYTYFQIFRNDGDFKFTDITLQAIGSYQSHFVASSAGGYNVIVSKIQLLDFNGDGSIDIVPSYNGSGNLGEIANGTAPVAWLNDGKGTFTKWKLYSGGATVTSSALQAAQPDIYSGITVIMDADGDGKLDLLLADTSKSTTSNQSLIQTKEIRFYTLLQQDISSNERLFTFAEQTYSALFPSHPASTWVADYYARCYTTGTCLGARDGLAYFYDGKQLLNLGSMFQYISKPATAH